MRSDPAPSIVALGVLGLLFASSLPVACGRAVVWTIRGVKHLGESPETERRRVFGPAYADAVEELRAAISPDEPYLLLSGDAGDGGGPRWARWELVPRRALFLGPLDAPQPPPVPVPPGVRWAVVGYANRPPVLLPAEEPLFQATDATRAAGSLVTLGAGARTAWHAHPLGQVLIVTAGTGRVQQWGQPIDEIRVRDVVRIPPNAKHWHGAAPATSMAHIAIVEQPANGSAVVWMEKVSQEQYEVPVEGQSAANTAADLLSRHLHSA